jgi:ketosteroid isomerase-like protein
MNRSHRLSLLTAAAVLALSLVACGSGGSAEDDVRAASENFVSAFKDENWDEVCSMMTKASRAQLERAGEALEAKDGCPGVWEKASKLIDAKAKEQLEEFEIDTVKVNGNTATVTSVAAGTDPARLRKEGGEWRVDVAG